MAQKHIVVVDDEPAFRVMLRKTLEAAGYRVSEAKNALELFKLGAYDLLLLDMKIPGIDGHKVLASLKEDEANKAPIIAMSGLSDATHRTRALTEGADAFLTKPLDTQVLLTTIADLLARAEEQ
jgi:DNA-binding response OmpR family regulator